MGIDPFGFKVLRWSLRTEQCGRLWSKTKKPCTHAAKYPFPACGRHATEDDIPLVRQRAAEAAKLHAHVRTPTRPACWRWPIPREVAALVSQDPWEALVRWQDGRCAVCDHGTDRVLDHDHNTGWIRGWLCRSCNVSEPHSAEPRFRRYRSLSAARRLDIWYRYSSNWYGDDRGILGGHPTYDPHRVDKDGVVLLDEVTVAGSPAFAISKALLR